MYLCICMLNVYAYVYQGMLSRICTCVLVYASVKLASSENQSSLKIVLGKPSCGQLFLGKHHFVARDRASLGGQLI